MLVHEILSSKGTDVVFTIRPDATVVELLDALAEHNIGALVVSSDGMRLEGIVSERDVVRKLRDVDARGQARVRDIMTTDIHTCSPQDNLGDLMGVMTQHRVRHVPIVDSDRLVGVLSIGDAVKSRMDELEFERDQLTHYLHGQ
jgi:CBS domain-containing protein